MNRAELELLLNVRDQASGPLKGIGKALGDVAKIAAGFVIGAGLAQLPGLVKGMINDASNLSESMSKVDVVFGKLSGGIHEWAKGSARSFGMSRQAALEAAGTYGNLFQAFGIGQPKAAEMSKTLVELAADLASFNNTSVEEAIVALRSGLSGETEPLKRYGIAISDARMRTELMAQGVKNLGTTLTPLQKTQAAYSLILKDSTLAQGDFARTADGLANKQRILSAEFTNVKASIGTALLPIMLTLGTFVLDTLIPGFGKLADAVGPHLGRAFDIVVPAARSLFDVGMELKRLFELGLGGGSAGGDLDKLSRAAVDTGTYFRTTLIPTVTAVADVVIKDLGPAFVTGSRVVLSFLDTVLRPFVEFVLNNKPVLAAAIAAIGVAIVVAFGPVSGALLALMGLITVIGLVKDNWSEFETFATTLWNNIKTKVARDVDSIAAKINELIRAYNSIPLAPDLGELPTNAAYQERLRQLGQTEAPDVPGRGYARGTSYVPSTGPALLHEGEAVLNRTQAAAYRSETGSAGDGMTINVTVSGPVYGIADLDARIRDAVTAAARSGALRGYVPAA